MLSIEEFAKLCARAESRPLSDVLVDAGLDEAAWWRDGDEILTALRRELGSAGADLSRRFLDTYFATVGAATAPVNVDETAAIDTRQLLASLGIPFGKSASSPRFLPDETMVPMTAAPMTLPFRSAPAKVPELPKTEDGDGETQLGASMGPKQALPFVSAAAGLTAAVDPGAGTGAAMPFEQVTLGLLKLEAYAEMAACLRARLESPEAVMARFGLPTTHQRERVHELWRARFEANPELRARFTKLVDEKVAELQDRASHEKP